MAFALTNFKADSVNWNGPGRTWNYQLVTFYITAANTDTDLDIGDLSGTFWTAAIADATYGDLATQALAVLTTIQAQAYALVGVGSPELLGMVKKASAPSTDEYSLTVTDSLPIIGTHSGDSPTAWTITLTILPIDGTQPINADLGNAIT